MRKLFGASLVSIMVFLAIPVSGAETYNVIHLQSDSNPYLHPHINDNGYVVWNGHDGSDFEIFRYDGSSTLQITNNTYPDRYPQINDNGYVVWEGLKGSADLEIFLYDGLSTIQLTDNTYDDYQLKISANDRVVWTATNSPYSLYYAFPSWGGGGGVGPAVGGVAEPITKLSLLIKWMTLAKLILLTIGIVVCRRVRK